MPLGGAGGNMQTDDEDDLPLSDDHDLDVEDEMAMIMEQEVRVLHCRSLCRAFLGGASMQNRYEMQLCTHDNLPLFQLIVTRTWRTKMGMLMEKACECDTSGSHVLLSSGRHVVSVHDGMSCTHI
jgi:hypothetical protein